MPALTFRQKLVISMMAVVSGITLAMLYIAERKLSQEFEARFRQEAEAGFKVFNTQQAVRLAELRNYASDLSTSVRLTAVLAEASPDEDEGIARIIYDVVENEANRPGARRLPVASLLQRVYDPSGRILMSSEVRQEENINRQLSALLPAIQSETEAEVGCLPIDLGGGSATLHDVYLAKIRDAIDGRLLGTMLFAVPFEPAETAAGAIYGLWAGGKLNVKDAPPEVDHAVRAVLQNASHHQGRSETEFSGTRHSISYRQLNPGSLFPPAYQVAVQSLEPMFAAKRELRAQIAVVGCVALAIALATSLILAGGLTAPIEQLAAATHEIERGNFDVKLAVKTGDEVGRLTESFNEMAAGLALREKYRSVLDMVADKKIAEDLIHGQIELGGEERQVSVLFCDIRGFTALTEHMQPQEVIAMLNEHFTPLTRLVYEHHGAVDKFVGDLIMAIFGAPKSFGNDAENAARCALRMIEERARLNQSGKYQIAIGIGVASGNVVAGRMGSKDRLNYTVLGPRVNLASRLCSKAGPMEAVIDEITWRSVQDCASANPTPELQLKGFATPVQAYKLHAFHHHESQKPQMASA